MNRPIRICTLLCVVGCGGSSQTSTTADAPRFSTDGGSEPVGNGPQLAGCPVLPDNHIFNTPIDTLPVDPNSAAYITTIGPARPLHLDLGQQTDQQAPDFYGIPYNIVDGGGLTWPQVSYTSTDPDLSWDPKPESDCGDANRGVVTPCTIASPRLPIPASVIVEGGISTASNHMPYADHHILVLDTDSCLLWEAYHAYRVNNVWQIFGSAVWDLRSNTLRPKDWSSADAAGFPILPLLLRPDEATTGEIKHALRFTILTSKIRGAYTWPATHKASTATATNLPPYGQLFRLKASFVIPPSWNTQSKAIATAMKKYGMYIADGGSDMYVSGAPGAWEDETFSQIQSVATSNFEAVDLSPIKARAGWSATSGAVPNP